MNLWQLRSAHPHWTATSIESQVRLTPMCCAVWGSHVLSVVGRRPDLEPQCSGEVGQGDGADGQGQGIESRQKTGQRRQSQSGLWRARSRSSWQSNSTHRPRFNRVTPRRGGRGAHGAICMEPLPSSRERRRRHPRHHHRRGFLQDVRDPVGFCREDDGGRPSRQGRGWLPQRSVRPGRLVRL